ncbi:hypothetical protein CHUAL_003385 [Chamberlinius hualienensis]
MIAFIFYVLALPFWISAATLSDKANILVVLPYAGKSHYQVFVPLVEELANRGHHITFITMTRPTKAIKNIDYIFTEHAANKFTTQWTVFASTTLKNSFSMKPMNDFMDVMKNACIALFEDPEFQNFNADITNRRSKYDIVIAMAMLSECYLPWIRNLGEMPLILISPSVPFHTLSWELNVPYPLTSVAYAATPFTSPMSFKQRLINSLAAFFYLGLYRTMVVTTADKISNKHLERSISSLEVLRNASLVLINSHISTDESRPTMPYFIDVGGMHCRPAQKLSKEFEDFMNDSGEDGVIVMSMGSVVQGNRLPDAFTTLFKNVFSQVKQKVIWKYEGTVEGLSPNVLTAKWIPQQDLMAHPKCRLAITHGGLLSLQEVVYHGVPLLGVPLGADRDFNINQATNKGFALILDWKTADVNETLSKINSLIYDERYKKKANELSVLTRDRPQPPLETAVYWVEYIIRHKGAPHLKNAGAQQLNLIQYLGLDILAFLLTILVIVLFIIYKSIRLLFSVVTRLIYSPKKLKTF